MLRDLFNDFKLKADFAFCSATMMVILLGLFNFASVDSSYLISLVFRASVVSLGLLSLMYLIMIYLKSLVFFIIIPFLLLHILIYANFPYWEFMIYLLMMISSFFMALKLRVGKRLWIKSFLLALLGTLFILGVNSYTGIFILGDVQSASVHQDTLFHSSIAAMIKNYGIASTGLYGLVPVNYHTFSHSLYAALSHLAGIGVLESYAIFTWMLFAPIFILVSWLVSSSLNWQFGRSLSVASPILLYVVVLLIVMLPPVIMKPWFVSYSYMNSESYLIANTVLLTGILILFETRFRVVTLLTALIFIYVLTNAKISVGFVYMALAAYVAMIQLKESIWLRLIAVGVLGMFFLWTGGFLFEEKSTNEIIFDPLEFIKNYSSGFQFTYGHLKVLLRSALGYGPPTPWPIALFSMVVGITVFLILHFCLSWIYIISTIRSILQAGIAKSLGHPIFLVVITCLLGIGVISTLKIPGGSVYYFSSISITVTLPFLAIVLKDKLQGLNLRDKSGFKVFMPVMIILILIAGTVGIDQYSKYLSKKEVGGADELVIKLQYLRDQAPKRVVFVIESEQDRLNPLDLCWGKPFLYPAILERPTLYKGWSEDCKYLNYGYGDYKLDSGNRPEVQSNVPAGFSLSEL